MFLLLALLGCNDGTTADSGAAVEVTTDLSYYRDIKPLVDTHCVRCHNDDGQGTGDFTDPTVVSDFATVMLNQIEAGLMPPPAADPACQDYNGSDALFLDTEEESTFREWVDGGQPLGDEADDPGVTPVRSELSNPDLSTVLKDPYTPTYSSIGTDDGNEYTCFVLDPGHTSDVYVTKMAPIVDNDAIVHHIVLYLVNREATEAYLDSGAFDCFGGVGEAVGDAGEAWLAAWAPGMQPIEFPEGAGLKMGQDQLIMMQTHYYAAEEGTSDQSGYAFNVTDSVDTEVFMYDPGIYNFRIPAGDEAYTDGGSFELPVDIDIHGVMPHMHVLGSGYEMKADDQCIVQSDRYSFANQMTYQFPEPLRVEAGSSLEFECTWNNSTSNPELINDPPETTTWGESTDEEMCYFFTYLSLP